jgi:hypothetical protein
MTFETQSKRAQAKGTTSKNQLKRARAKGTTFEKRGAFSSAQLILTEFGS